MYPLEDARKLDDITMVANKERINPDMFIDQNKESIYAMTSFKVRTSTLSFSLYKYKVVILNIGTPLSYTEYCTI